MSQIKKFIYFSVLCVFFGFGPSTLAQPINDECNTAEHINNVQSWCSPKGAYTNSASTPSGFGTPGCWTNSNNDVWFSFDASATAILITVNGNSAGSGTLNSPQVALYSGNCATGITEMQCESSPGGNTVSLYKSGLVVGDRYYIRVDGLNNFTGTFQLCVDNYFPPVFPGADCNTASHLCSKDTISFANLTGYGADGREPVGTCLNGTATTGPIEDNSVWFTWTAADAGAITFDIIPTDPADDLDFAVYEMPNGNCGDIQASNAIRCCASGASSPSSPCMGPTGLNMTSIDQVENLGCYATDDNYVQFIQQVPGRMYGLIINNFSSSGNGFTLQWGGDGQFAGPSSGFTFTGSNDSICFDNPTITFTDTSINPDTIKWDFGRDAMPATAIGGGPHTVTYGSPGVKYIVQTVTGPGGCRDYAIDTLFIAPPTQIDTTITPVLCNGDETGAIDIEIAEGITPVDYAWNGGTLTGTVTTQDLTGIGAGFYNLQITDDIGCVSTFTLEVTEPDAISENPTIQDDECGAGIGSVDPGIAGGTPPYTYAWSDGQTGPVANNLSEGNIDLTVTDDNGCTETFSYTVGNTEQPISDAGPDDNVCGFEYRLNAVPSVGSGSWQSNEPSATFQNQFAPSTNVTVSVYGAIEFYWIENNGVCSDTDTVVITFNQTPTADGGPDGDVCGNSIQLTASPSSGTGVWEDNTGGSITYFPNNTSPNVFADYNPLPPGGATVEFYWIETNAGCSDTDTVVVNYYDLPPAVAGPGGSVCGFTFNLNAASTVGNGTWTATDLSGNPVSVTYNPDANTEAAAATVTGYGSVIFQWTVDQGVCNSQDTNLVRFLQTPTANAGGDDTTCTLDYMLSAVPSVGTGTWTSSDPTATFSNANDPNAVATVLNYGNVSFYWTEENGICSDRDTVNIEFFQVPPFDAGPNQDLCASLSTTMSGSTPGPTGSGIWTATDTLGNVVSPVFSDATSETSTIDFTAIGYGVYNLIWTIDYNFCSVADTAVISFYQQPAANAGMTDSVCGTAYALNATRSLPIGVGSGLWTSTNPSASFSDASNPNTTVTVAGFGTSNFIWTESNGPCSDDDTVAITFVQQPSPNAGTDQTVCSNVATLTATPSVGNGSWTASNPAITFTAPNSPVTDADASAAGYGVYELYFTEINSPCAVTDTVIVEFLEQPISFAGNDTNICGNSFTAQALSSAGTGTWSSSSGSVTFTNPNNPNTTVSVSAFGPVTLTWTEDNNGCIDSDDVVVNFEEVPVANAGPDQDVCSLSGSLSAVPSVGTGTWSSNAALNFGAANNPNSTVDASGVGYGTYTIYWTETNGNCSEVDSMEFTFYEQPNADAGVMDSVCSEDYQLAANPSVGNGVWSLISGPATISNPTSPNATLTATGTGRVDLEWTETNGPCSSTSSTSIWFFAPVNPEAGPSGEICGLTYTLTAEPAVGTGSWSGPAGVVFANPNSPVTTVDATAAGFGTYTLYWTDDNVICQEVDSVEIAFYDAPNVSINAIDETIYTTDPFYQFIGNSNRGDFWLWDFGDGTTADFQSPNKRYEELGNFTVTLTVTDSLGCSNSTTAIIRVKDDLRAFIPNAFTPDNDDINDEFKPSIIGHFPNTYEMRIYDRWGKLVFQTRELDEGWNGQLNNENGKLPNGTYSYVISYDNYARTTIVRKGMVILVR